jgi:hypothetical protein
VDGLDGLGQLVDHKVSLGFLDGQVGLDGVVQKEFLVLVENQVKVGILDGLDGLE